MWEALFQILKNVFLFTELHILHIDDTETNSDDGDEIAMSQSDNLKILTNYRYPYNSTFTQMSKFTIKGSQESDGANIRFRVVDSNNYKVLCIEQDNSENKDCEILSDRHMLKLFYSDDEHTQIIIGCDINSKNSLTGRFLIQLNCKYLSTFKCFKNNELYRLSIC